MPRSPWILLPPRFPLRRETLVGDWQIPSPMAAMKLRYIAKMKLRYIAKMKLRFMAGVLHHLPARAPLAAGAVQTAVAEKQLTSIHRPGTVNPCPPGTMPHAGAVEGVKDFQERQGVARNGAGLPPKIRDKYARNLTDCAWKVVDELTLRTPTHGMTIPSMRIVLGQSKEATTATDPPQVLSAIFSRFRVYQGVV